MRTTTTKPKPLTSTTRPTTPTAGTTICRMWPTCWSRMHRTSTTPGASRTTAARLSPRLSRSTTAATSLRHSRPWSRLSTAAWILPPRWARPKSASPTTTIWPARRPRPSMPSSHGTAGTRATTMPTTSSLSATLTTASALPTTRRLRPRPSTRCSTSSRTPTSNFTTRW